MRAIRILHERLTESMSFMHAGRWRALWSAVESLLGGGDLWLTGLGRSRPGDVSAKHAIKAMDRLLGNQVLYAERRSVASALAQFMLKKCKSPIVLVDAVEIRHETFALSAAIAFDGRSFPLYDCVIGVGIPKKAILDRFLGQLSLILPPECTPIFVTDAGFRGPWFDLLEDRGWDYVGRLRGNGTVCVDGSWLSVAELHKKATTRDRSLGIVRLPKRKPRDRRVVLSKKRKSSNRWRHTSRGTRGQREDDFNYAKSANEPLVLATSLTCNSSHVVKLYSLRMQIEQNFRDKKNHRWGWSFRHMGSRCHTRIELLLLVASIAYFVQQWIGVAGERAGLHRRHQANTMTKRRALSLFVLGKWIIRRRELRLLTAPQLDNALFSLRTTIRSHSPP